MPNRKIRLILLSLVFILILSLSYPIVKGLVLNLSETSLTSFDEVTEYKNSNRYTQVDDLTVAENLIEIDDSYSVINTVIGSVYYDPSSLAFAFVNENGYIWSSTVGSDGPKLNTSWRKKATSALWLYYFDEDGKEYEENLLTSDSTVITITEENNALLSHIYFGNSGISLDFNLYFEADGIRVDVPYTSIMEGDYLIGSLVVYPFFGAVGNSSTPGYVFIPDGVGALVRYKDAKNNIYANYEKEFYGRDITYVNSSDMNSIAQNGASLSLPVFGFVHGINQNAIFANIINGSEYGILNVYYAGVSNLDYTTVFPTFVYRKRYSQPIDKNGTTIYLLQDEKNEFDIEIKYTVLNDDDANYVGMAKEYAIYLESTGMNKKSSTITDTPLLLETVGLEISKGDFFNERSLMTTFKEYIEIINTLKEEGIYNITGLVNGFTARGYSWSAPLYNKVAKSLGNKDDIEELQSLLENLYFETDYTKASNKSSGYSSYSDLAKKINMQTYIYEDAGSESYLLSIEKTLSLYQNSASSLSSYGIDSLAISSLGSLLYGDYNASTTRSDMIEAYASILSSEENIGLYSPNAYLFNNLDAYFDADLYSSQYITFDDTVPFITIALNGFFPIYSTNANFYSNAKDELLRLVDYNVYLSFIVTDKSSSLFLETPLEYIYSSKFTSIDPAIELYYKYVNDALKNVINASLVSRVVLSPGVVVNAYDNGVEIIVNYTNSDYSYNGSIIKAKDYGVIS
ncbi:MAG: hypothetical protein H6687_02410 [Bacillales bacterium]|nr:hypothetical protein [Bacillales bacterium]